MRKQRKLLVAIFSLTFVTGCAGLPSLGGNKQSAPELIYTIQASGSEPSGPPRHAKGPVTIAVPKPELPAGLDTERIALYLDQGHRLDYYADAKWSARLDDLLQDFLIEKVRQRLPGKIVGTPDLGASARYKLAIKVTEFGPVYAATPDKPPRLDVGMTVTVLAGDMAKTQFTVKKSATAAENKLKDVTGGLENVLQSATDEALQKAAPFLG